MFPKANSGSANTGRKALKKAKRDQKIGKDNCGNRKHSHTEQLSCKLSEYSLDQKKVRHILCPVYFFVKISHTDLIMPIFFLLSTELVLSFKILFIL